MPGNEFGAILDPDLDPDQPVEAFEEYAKAPHMEAGIISDGSGSGGGGTDAVDTVRGGGRKDGRAELLVIGRQDWISTVKCSTRYCLGPTYRSGSSQATIADPNKDST